MPKFTVAESIQIDAPLSKVYAIVRDFTQWPRWSPWLICEPGCPVDVADDGRSYSWDGKIVGSGNMAITSESENQQIEYKLTFLKPWKSVSSVQFAFAESESGTRLTWTMQGSLPFFMFWMKGMMAAVIGMDYQRGLAMLKDYAETGQVPSTLEFPGVQAFKGFAYLGIRTRCTKADIGDKMAADFEKLNTFVAERSIAITAEPLSIYHKFDLVKGLVDYTAAIPVASAIDDLPDGLFNSTLPDCKTYSIKHTGPYHHLGNPWSAGMMHSRAKAFKQSKAIHPFESYGNDPKEVAANDLVTTVHFPAV